MAILLKIASNWLLTTDIYIGNRRAATIPLAFTRISILTLGSLVRLLCSSPSFENAYKWAKQQVKINLLDHGLSAQITLTLQFCLVTNKFCKVGCFLKKIKYSFIWKSVIRIQRTTVGMPSAVFYSPLPLWMADLFTSYTAYETPFTLKKGGCIVGSSDFYSRNKILHVFGTK